MKIEIILAQFGSRSGNVQPSYNSFKNSFPEATFKMYSDQPQPQLPFETIVLKTPYDPSHPRYGHRCNDLYKAVGLLDSKADICIAVDSDMLIVLSKPGVSSLIPLTVKFGMCLPMNPRWLVKTDCMIGEDSDRVLDETGGNGFAMNMSPISFFTKCDSARGVLDRYAKQMRHNVARGPLAMWRAVWKGGDFYSPYLLPPQWCVCAENCGVGDEVVLHVGHEKVSKYYDC